MNNLKKMLALAAEDDFSNFSEVAKKEIDARVARKISEIRKETLNAAAAELNSVIGSAKAGAASADD